MKNSSKWRASIPGFLRALVFCLLPGFAWAQATLMAAYDFDDPIWCTRQTVPEQGGGIPGAPIGPVERQFDEVPSGGKPTTGAAARFDGNGTISFSGLPIDTATGSAHTVSFWMYWDGTDGLLFTWGGYSLFFYTYYGSTTLRINGGGILYATLASGRLDKGWHHIAVTLVNGKPKQNVFWIDGVPTVTVNSPDVVRSVAPEASLGGSFYGFIDQLRFYKGAITQAQVDADRTATSTANACPATMMPLAEYRFDDVAWCTPYRAINTLDADQYPGVVRAWVQRTTDPTLGAGARMPRGDVIVSDLPLNTGTGEYNSVSFWMYWEGGDEQVPFSFGNYGLFFFRGSLRIGGTYAVPGINSLAKGWHHIAATFTNGNSGQNTIWIDGVNQKSRMIGSGWVQAVTGNSASIGAGSGFRFGGELDSVRIYKGRITQAQVEQDFTAARAPAVDCPAYPPTLLSQFSFNEAGWEVLGKVKNSVDGGADGVFQNFHIGNRRPEKITDPARLSGKIDTCAAASIRSGGQLASSSAQIDTTLRGRNSVSFWMYWDGAAWQTPFQFKNSYMLQTFNAHLGFSAYQDEFRLPDSSSLAVGWHHIAAVFVNGYLFGNKLWIDGVPQTLAVTRVNINATVNNTATDGFEFRNMLDEIRVYRGEIDTAQVLADMQRTAPCGGLLSGFNCVANGQPGKDGHLYTRLAGKPFTFEVVALDKNGEQLKDYVPEGKEKTVVVSLVDGDDNLDCASRAQWVGPGSLKFIQGDQGRKRVEMTSAKAYRHLKCRVTYTDDLNKAQHACSTDGFAVRPTAFSSVISKTANAAGLSTDTPWIKAGQAFSLTAEANAPNYSGTPIIQQAPPLPAPQTNTRAHVGAEANGLLTGSFSASDPKNSTATGDQFTYSEVGYFSLAANSVYDDSFTAIDKATGDCTNDFSNEFNAEQKVGCKFGNDQETPKFGRFVPDHFVLVEKDWEAACGGFSYMDQAFKKPLAVVLEAQNAAGARTQNYQGSYATGKVEEVLNNQDGKKIETARLVRTEDKPWENGRYSLKASHFSRLSSPDGPFDALDIGLTVNDPNALKTRLQKRNMSAESAACTEDMSGLSEAPGVCTAVRLVEKTKVRFGRLHLGNAYGSERLPLKVPVSAQYWNGNAFILNKDDYCTALAAANIALSTTELGVPTISPLLSGGRGSINFAGPGRAGSVDLALHLGASGASLAKCPLWSPVTAPTAAERHWLRSQWCKTTHDYDPAARATFGIPKSPVIYRRENY